MARLKIKDAPLLTSIIGDEKIPTGGKGDFTLTPSMLLSFVEERLPFATTSQLESLRQTLDAKIDTTKTELSLSISQLESRVTNNETSVLGVVQDLTLHKADKSNPHSVTKAQVGLGNVDNTSDVNKPISTATQAALNQKANTQQLTDGLSLKLDKQEAQDKIYKNGAALPYDASVAYNEGAVVVKDGELKQKQGTYWMPFNKSVKSSDVKLEDGSTQADFNARQLRKTHHVLDFGMKMDGSDETSKLNEIISQLDNCRLIIGGGNLKVSKTSLYTSDFPNNDQPCIPVVKKNNFTIEIQEDCIISVNEHAQSVFEMIQCVNCNIEVNGVIKGAGNFPQIDGNTGRAEKGTATEGYATTGFWGHYKNNSFDTSNNSTGGYGGNFPQWGGGTANTWGMWNGGFIGNQGFGVLIHKSSKSCKVFGVGSIYGFNGGGVKFGTYQDTEKSEGLECFGIDIHDCYDAGVTHSAVKNYKIYSNNIYNIGHPDSKETDQYFDSGYGSYATSTNLSNTPEDGEIFDNNFSNCVRKGLDVHAGIRLKHYKNIVTDCGVCGAFSSYSSANQISIGTEFVGNTFIRCGYVGNVAVRLGAIYMNGITNSGAIKIDAKVKDNTLIDCAGGTAIVNIQSGDSCELSGNIINGLHPKHMNQIYAINLGRSQSSQETTRFCEVKRNTVYAKNNENIVYGIHVNKCSNSDVSSNYVFDTNSCAFYFAPTSAANFSVDFENNHASVSKGLAYGIARTHGNISGNTMSLSGSATVGNLNNSDIAGIYSGRLLSLKVTFNGTANPTFTSSGSDFVDSVVSDANGLKVNLKNVTSAAILMNVLNNSSSRPTAGSTTVGYIYQREVFGQSGGVLGFKATAESTSHVAATTLTSGTIDILIQVA